MGTLENVPNRTPVGAMIPITPRGSRHPCFSFIPATLPIALTRMSSKYRRCRCPKWIDGYVDGKRFRQSAETRSWEQAEREARSLEDASDPAKPPQPKVTTIADAVAVFMADERGRDLSIKETTKQSKTLFEKQLLPWAKHRGLNRFRDLTVAELVNFRATRKNNGLTGNRKLSRLVGFFAFCIQNGWLIICSLPMRDSRA